MNDPAADELFRRERDAVVTLGMLAYHYATFDPAVSVGGKSAHGRGFNVRAVVVDNRDGEVAAVGQNQIHANENPLQHAEQVAVRAALERLKRKYPRPARLKVDAYYKTLLFMAPGSQPHDFLRAGCTLYNTFDPCGMCAVTLLVCYMKRIAYLFDDAKFADVYDHMRKYFAGRESIKEPVLTGDAGPASPLIERAAARLAQLRTAVHERETGGTPLVETLDSCHELLGAAAEEFAALAEADLATNGDDRRMNQRTLEDLQRLCNVG